jgi:hypothetical protein
MEGAPRLQALNRNQRGLGYVDEETENRITFTCRERKILSQSARSTQRNCKPFSVDSVYSVRALFCQI